MSKAGLRENLDMLEECRAQAHLKTMHYQRTVSRLYNRRIRPRPIGEGDLVLKKAEVSRLLLRGGVVVERLVKVHLDISIFGTFDKGVLFDRYLRVLPPKSLEHYSVPKLIADPPHLLKA
ncbi:hypothetical protein BHM03_00007313 [Ensete ventricosum]|nr:hypothetical protein BHM03_00007313 [Ensete ventricosum]